MAVHRLWLDRGLTAALALALTLLAVRRGVARDLPNRACVVHDGVSRCFAADRAFGGASAPVYLKSRSPSRLSLSLQLLSGWLGSSDGFPGIERCEHFGCAAHPSGPARNQRSSCLGNSPPDPGLEGIEGAWARYWSVSAWTQIRASRPTTPLIQHPTNGGRRELVTIGYCRHSSGRTSDGYEDQDRRRDAHRAAPSRCNHGSERPALF